MFEHIRPLLSHSIALDESLKSRRALIIASHPMDEVIGCAGAAIKLSENGGHVEILYCTNEGEDKMKQSEAASAVLGSKKNHFLQFNPRSLNGNKRFDETLSSVIKRVKPNVVFLPFWLEPHTDHAAISKSLIKINAASKLNFMVYAYGLNLPILPNAVVDISGVWDKKVQAVESYRKNPPPAKNYLSMVRDLNSYWGERKRSGMQFAEPFFKTSAQEYIALGRKIFR